MKKQARMESLKKMKEKLKKKGMEDMDMSGMSKVTVMSDSEEGLAKGLSKAEEILEKRLGMEEEEDSDEYMDGGCSSKKKKYMEGGVGCGTKKDR